LIFVISSTFICSPFRERGTPSLGIRRREQSSKNAASKEAACSRQT
jgi:hypothetical protein